jgi:hypothetical protein
MQPTHKESPRGADSPNGHPSSPNLENEKPKGKTEKNQRDKIQKTDLGKTELRRDLASESRREKDLPRARSPLLSPSLTAAAPASPAGSRPCMYVQLRGNVSSSFTFGGYVRTCIVVYVVFTLCIGVKVPIIFSLVIKSHFVTCFKWLKIYLWLIWIHDLF